MEIKVNGVSVYSGSNLNTGGADITAMYMGSCGNTGQYYDNIFIADDWVGEMKSYLCQPTSDVAVAFTPSAGSDNFAMVDDDAQDGDTTYVESNTVDHQDLYGYSDLPAGVDVGCVTLVTPAKKTDAGARVLQQRAQQDAVEYALEEFALATAYPAAPGAGIFETLDAAPDATAWTREKFNAIDWGFKVSS